MSRPGVALDLSLDPCLSRPGLGARSDVLLQSCGLEARGCLPMLVGLSPHHGQHWVT